MLQQLLRAVWGTRVGNTRVVPVTSKILFVFIAIILVSNLASNYINLMFNRTELIRLMKDLLGKDLRDVYTFCNNQYEIFQLTRDEKKSLEALQIKGRSQLKNSRAVVLGLRQDGSYFFTASKFDKVPPFEDGAALDIMKKNRSEGIDEGFLPLKLGGREYFAAYKYNSKWNIYLVRAEEENEFYQRQRTIFRDVSIIIGIITFLSAVVGALLLRYILRYVPILTRSIMRMAETQQLEIVDLSKAPNDDITYLGMAFNSLSSTVNNLINIFRKFANQDIVAKAYRDREVRLEGVQRNLTILFSDIRSFTFITETLGTDIIRLLNLHYDRAIREIIEHDGIIGSIIGDALLAVFGALDEISATHKNKSLQAVLAGYKLQQVAADLRSEMKRKRDEILRQKGKLSPEEERVYRAVLLEVGVGIDGGEVFYGTLGSYVRMTNTVIGDNVNAASRLEGLTRIYKVPVICSEFVRREVEAADDEEARQIYFAELDTVLVKGKTTGTKIYWPILRQDLDSATQKALEEFDRGLKLYYHGDWPAAYRYFSRSKLDVAKVFAERTHRSKAPPHWNGIWEMKSK
ncbi:MAG: adenylate/guanylate cyclase domain-containing protein [Turneriella sp.]|nr:adenylate/guanylate cyclase domain-containing protein [Turneriella sp.]